MMRNATVQPDRDGCVASSSETTARRRPASCAGRFPGQIMCGDFNVTPASDVVATLLAAGLDYAYRGLAGICTCNSNGEPKLIDYLFCSDALRARPIDRKSTRLNSSHL